MGVAEAGLGLLLGAYNDKRQNKQQKHLNDLQIQGGKEMGLFNQGLAKDMWDYTNYENQVKHMKNAGVNPALLYGGGGGGGATASTPTGSVSGANAPVGGNEVGMGIQMGMMEAQKELLRAQAENLEADTKKKLGVDTKLGEANIQATVQNALKTELENNYMGKGAYKDGMTGYEVRYQKEAAEMYNTAADTEIKKLKFSQMPTELANDVKRVFLEGQKVAIDAQNARTAEERNRITERIEALRRNLALTMQGNDMYMEGQAQNDRKSQHSDIMEQKDQDQLMNAIDKIFSATVPWYEPSTTTETRRWSDDGKTYKSGGSTTTKSRN